MPYLYGVSVQGIQSYIFETNKLKEMVGASEIVEKLSRKDEFWKDFFHDFSITIKDENWIREAAGNIRFICDKKEDLEKIVRYFPLKAQVFAPSISVSQAVVEFSGDLKDLKQKDINDLEKNLKIQRNKPLRPPQLGLTAMARAPRTGKPAYKRDEEDLLDFGNAKKQNNPSSRLIEKLLGEQKHFLEINDKTVEFTSDMEKISRPNDSWIAVIHADGNGIGTLLQELGTQLEQKKKIAEGSRDFSKFLDEATTEAAKQAFQNIVVQRIRNNEIKLKQEKDNKTFLFPIRPIVLGGDDITIICRADLAIDFTVEFLKQFKIQTKEKLKNGSKEGLTACAGVTFIKDKYPFHYGYGLAEALCSQAKKRSKEIDPENIPSSLAFHKVQASFYDSYENTVKQELTIHSKDNCISLNFGPYAVEDIPEMPAIKPLLGCVEHLQEENSPKSGLRRWLSELWENQDSADQLLSRLVQITTEKNNSWIDTFNHNMRGLTKGEMKAPILSLANPISNHKTPIYDMLTLASLGGKE